MFINGTDETDNLNLLFHSEYRHTVYINSEAVYLFKGKAQKTGFLAIEPLREGGGDTLLKHIMYDICYQYKKVHAIFFFSF